MPPATSPDARRRMHRVLSGSRPEPTASPRPHAPAEHGSSGPPGTGDGGRPPDDRIRAWVFAGDDGSPPGDPPDQRPPAGVTRRAATVAALMALVALLVAVPRALVAEPDVEPLPARSEPAPSAAALRPSGDALPVSAPTPAGAVPLPTPGSAPVLVHVVGQVRRPGLVRLEAGARLADAVRKAGGATRRADLTRVNLARPLKDGEQVFVPLPGQALPAAEPPAAPGSASSGPDTPVDLNTADEAALDALPGIGPVIAGRIVAWRQEHGSFTSVDELTEVSGIGDATLERLRPLVRT